MKYFIPKIFKSILEKILFFFNDLKGPRLVRKIFLSKKFGPVLGPQWVHIAFRWFLTHRVFKCEVYEIPVNNRVPVLLIPSLWIFITPVPTINIFINPHWQNAPVGALFYVLEVKFSKNSPKLYFCTLNLKIMKKTFYYYNFFFWN